jgi:hypothetical protein
MACNLIDYLPRFLQEIREYKALTDTEQPEMTLLWDELDDVQKDQFVVTATINGVSRWEAVLNIKPKASDSLEDRKFRIMTRLNEQIPYTITGLRKQMETLCGAGNYEILLDNGAYTLSVKVGLAAKNNYDDVDAMVNRMVPANLLVDISLKYNQHVTLEEYTHQQLASYTHYKLRNEVLK